MGIKQAVQQAKTKYQEGDYMTALKLLSPYKDNPKIASMMAKISSEMASSKSKPSKAALGCIASVFLCFVVIMIATSGSEFVPFEQSAKAYCEWATSKGSDCTAKDLLDNHLEALIFCENELGIANAGNFNEWHQCMTLWNVNVFD